MITIDNKNPTRNGWIAVDLDGTLAEYESFKGPTIIGRPIKPMVDRVRKWLEVGYEVRIFTARVSVKEEEQVARRAIWEWTKEHIGVGLMATNIKDYAMIEQWDDRAVQVIPNTGIPIGEKPSVLIA